MARLVDLVFILMVLAGGAAMGSLTTPNDNTLVLDSGKLKIVFDKGNSGLALKSFTDAAGHEWLSEFGPQCILWAIALKGPDGAQKEITSRTAGLVWARRTSRGASFAWSADLGDKQATVNLSVRIPKGSGLSYWSMAVELPESWQVTRADFPVLPNLRISDGLKLATATCWGIEREVKPGLECRMTYPSMITSMQFVGFYGGGNGLYVGLHDPMANHKLLAVKAGENEVGFACTNYPAIPEPPTRVYKVPYEAAIGVFEGEYWDAAQIYREFTFKTPWGKAGAVSKRPIPQWVKDTEIWLRPDEKPVANAKPTIEAAEFFGVPISLHWYNWHQIPFDTLYPEYFPAKPHFEQGVKALQMAGLNVMPYINGRLCDPNSRTWKEEGGESAAARKEDGEPYTEVYGSKVPLNAMCPYTDMWQQKIVGLVDKLVNEYGVRSVYIDQICAAWAVQCFDASHGHPLGGGQFWAEGYRKMLDLARAKLPKDHALTTEENAECWIDQLDALLMVNTPNWGRIIPLFPSVYSGRTIVFGYQYFRADDVKMSLGFRLKTAMAFVYGSQLGWIKVSQIMAPEVRKEAEFLRDLARCRRFGHEFLVYGRFLGMIEVGGKNLVLNGEGPDGAGGTYPIETPSVIASAWQAENGSLGIALVNLADEAREVEMELPLKKAGLAGKRIRVKVYGPQGELPTKTGSSAIQKLRVPERSALILCAEGV